MLIAVNQCHPFELHNPMLYLLSSTWTHSCYFPTPQTLVAQKIDEDNEGVVKILS
jgi:hypothetical protein